MTAVMVCGLSVSCEPANNDEPNEEPKEETPVNPLAGTLWAEEDSAPTYVEFTGDNTVSLWGGYKPRCNGTYYIVPGFEDAINFSLRGEDVYEFVYVFTNGFFTNNTLRINYYKEYYDEDNVFHRTENHTLTLYKR